MPDGLRQELNAATAEAVFRRVYFREGTADGSSSSSSDSSDYDSDDVSDLQVGAAVWTRAQRAAAYNALARRGRADVRGAAAAAGRSAPETLDLLRAMDEAAVEAALADPLHPVLGAGDVPAAVEVPEALLARLSEGARGIEAWVQRWQAREERAKWGDGLWDLDWGTAIRLRQSYHRVAKEERAAAEASGAEAMEVDDAETAAKSEDVAVKDESGSASKESPQPGEMIDMVPIAKVLKLHNWLRLSNNIFMNKRKPRHWMKPCPSIWQTAFGDFYNLTVSVTKRIMSTALIQAQIRLRGLGGEAQVSKKDVKCALEMLGLAENSFDYWVGVPKRFRLKCFLPPSGPKDQEERKEAYLTVPEAEEYLKREKYKPKGSDSDSDSDDERMDEGSMDTSGHSESEYESSHVSETDDDDEMDADDAGSTPVYYSDGATSAWSSDDGGDDGPAKSLTRHGRRRRGLKPTIPRSRSGSSDSSTSSSGSSTFSSSSASSTAFSPGRAGRIRDDELRDARAAAFDAAHEPVDRGFARRQADALRAELEAERREEAFLDALDADEARREAERLRRVLGGDLRYVTRMQRAKRLRPDEDDDEDDEGDGGSSDDEGNPAAGLTRAGSRAARPRKRSCAAAAAASASSRHATPGSVKEEYSEVEVEARDVGAFKKVGRYKKTTEDVLYEDEPKLERKKMRIVPNPDVEKKRLKSERQHRQAVRAFEALGMDTVTRHGWRDVTEYISPWETRIINDLEADS
jgi:hypothetical protein